MKKTDTKIYISFVIPVHNEEGNIKKLHQEILQVANQLQKKFEIIYIDDGSTDASAQKLKALKQAAVITFRKNFGQTAALDAGIHYARGEYVVTLDGDLQNDPHDVPKMLEKLIDQNLDVVCGWRKNRKDPFSKKFISKVAKLLRTYLVADGIHDSGCTLRVYRNDCFKNLHIKGEMHRFITAILRWQGFSIGEMPVNHRPRTSGISKYGMKRTIKGFLDMLNVWFWRKYESRPLHMFGGLGLLMMFFSTALTLVLIYKKIFTNYALNDKIWPSVAFTGFSLGLQLLVSGLLANLIIENKPLNKTHYHIKSIESN